MAPAARLPGLRGAALFTSLKRMRSMRSTMDLTPLYRASIGFDRIADLMDRALASDIATPTYPPYNIEKTGENAYRISIAVAGFTADDLSVEMKDGAVIVSARKVEEDQGRTFLHRGIATRAFERKFALADHVRVTGASHVDGMLHIELVREVPEALKPRKIEISKSAAQTLEAEEVKKLDAGSRQATASGAPRGHPRAPFSCPVASQADSAADLLGERQVRMGRDRIGDPRQHLGREGRNAAAVQIDMQDQVLADGGGFVRADAAHGLDVVQPLRVMPDQARFHDHPVARMKFAQVMDLRLRGEDGGAGFPCDLRAQPQGRKRDIQRIVEQHAVIGHVQVAVVVGPLRTDLQRRAGEGRGHAGLCPQPGVTAADARAAPR